MLFVETMTGCVASLPPSPTLEESRRASELVDQGTALLRRGALKEAQASFEVSFDLDQTAAALDGLGCVAFLSGDVELARDYFLLAYEQDHSYSQSLANLALLYDYIGAKEESRVLFERALGGDVDNAPTRNNLGVLLEEGGAKSAATSEMFRAYVVLPHEIIGKNLEQIGEKPWRQ
ncbi:MAG: hypothetical protein KDD70_03890 [Bdellovibrionales bacterium]|nr:hypothetical protein [Bdellovibrionales bacterium]